MGSGGFWSRGVSVCLGREDVGPQTAALPAPPITSTAVLARNAAHSSAALLGTAGRDAVLSTTQTWVAQGIFELSPHLIF